MKQNQYALLNPTYFKLDGGAMFGIIPKPLWNKKYSCDQENRINLSTRLLLIKQDKRTILIDTGLGNYHDDKFVDRFQVSSPKINFEKLLANLNLSPLDITDLVLSHLHFDHAGGILDYSNNRAEIIFKNATLHIHKAHYEHAKNPTLKDTGSFHFIYIQAAIDSYLKLGQLNWLQGLSGEILPQLNFITSMGHTPYMIHPYDEHYIYLADLIPTHHHLPIPWVMGYDLSPGITVDEKVKILDFIYKNNLTIVYEHDPEYYGSKITGLSNEKYNFLHLDDRKLSANYLTTF